MLNPPVYAALVGGLLIILQALLMLSAGGYRGRNRKAVGVDGDVTLERLVRRHGNLAENAAIFIVVLGLYEILVGSTWLVSSLAAVFLIARLSHAVAFSSAAGSHMQGAEGGGRVFLLLRMIGAGFTALSFVVLGVALVIAVLPML